MYALMQSRLQRHPCMSQPRKLSLSSLSKQDLETGKAELGEAEWGQSTKLLVLKMAWGFYGSGKRFRSRLGSRLRETFAHFFCIWCYFKNDLTNQKFLDAKIFPFPKMNLAKVDRTSTEIKRIKAFIWQFISQFTCRKF